MNRRTFITITAAAAIAPSSRATSPPAELLPFLTDTLQPLVSLGDWLRRHPQPVELFLTALDQGNPCATFYEDEPDDRDCILAWLMTQPAGRYLLGVDAGGPGIVLPIHIPKSEGFTL